MLGEELRNLTKSSPKALEELQAEGMLPKTIQLRQNKYLNNIVEQDHRFIQRLVKPGLGFKSFNLHEGH